VHQVLLDLAWPSDFPEASVGRKHGGHRSLITSRHVIHAEVGDMRIGILGSGLMGATLGTIFARAGHDVVFSLEQVAEGYRAMDDRRAIKTLLRP
jgi:pyruvate/2-oxoglutarate dehydrogenase complex dihydrolipoamide dehydrogenase (E3) component